MALMITHAQFCPRCKADEVMLSTCKAQRGTLGDFDISATCPVSGRLISDMVRVAPDGGEGWQVRSLEAFRTVETLFLELP
jgi:hypothetical protein